MDDTDHRQVEARITSFERALLLHGVRSWSGADHGGVMVASALGLASTDALGQLTSRLERLLGAGESLPPEDWRAALFLTEVGFVSSVAGRGDQWPTSTGLNDTVTFEALRTLQRRLQPIVTQATAGPPWPGVTRTRSAPVAHIQYASVSGDGMHVELCAGRDADPVVLFRAEREGEITCVVGGPLSDLERAIEIAKKEVHCEEYYDATE